MRHILKLILMMLLFTGPIYADSFTFTAFFPDDESLAIDGPEGVEYFEFGFEIDIIGPLFVNEKGICVGNAEATSDPFVYAAIYGTGGSNGERFQGGDNNYWTNGTGNFFSLGWDAPKSSFSKPRVLGLTEDGVATAEIQVWLENGGHESFVQEWYVGQVAEPATAFLLGLGMIAASAGMRKKK